MRLLARFVTLASAAALLAGCETVPTAPQKPPEPELMAKGCFLFDPATRQMAAIPGCLDNQLEAAKHQQVCNAEVERFKSASLVMDKVIGDGTQARTPAANLAIVLWLQNMNSLRRDCGLNQQQISDLVKRPIPERLIQAAADTALSIIYGKCTYDPIKNEEICPSFRQQRAPSAMVIVPQNAPAPVPQP